MSLAPRNCRWIPRKYQLYRTGPSPRIETGCKNSGAWQTISGSLSWAVLVSSLQILLKKTNDYLWTEECDKAFNGIKDALTHAPVLALPDLRPFEVICDACGIGLGAVLLQDGGPIAFEGKRMSLAEQNHHMGEQELLAFVHALELWRCHLDGTEFTVVTDHSLNTFFGTKKLLSPR